MKERLNNLINSVLVYAPRANVDLIRKAYDFAEKHHHDQKRSSGEPYITHPVAVAELLASLKLDVPSIITGLLHDTIEDTAATLEDVRKEFGKEIEFLVQGVTKLARIEVQSNLTQQAENFRKLVLAMSDDIRVLLIKLCDRLHNMRTIEHLPREEARRRISLETLEIYAPLAERMGMNTLQEELQDLSFAQLNPDAYKAIVERIQHLHQLDKNTTALLVKDLQYILKKGGITAEVVGREKRPYSIWKKMQSKNVTFEQLSDVIAFRVLVDSIADCYQCLGLIHSEYFVIPGRFKDYISTPKPNNYRSLHTHVIGPNQYQIEIQIRTKDMQKTSEYGVAAHWKYKQGLSSKKGTQYPWVRGLLDILKNASEADEFLENTKLEMFQDQVFCFTPRGDIIPLPRGATPVDFAYAVHSDVGDKCRGAKINGKLMPLRTALRNGDQVEIISSPTQTPSPTWERFVVTGRAKAHIRRFIRSRKLSQFIVLGKSMLLREIKDSEEILEAHLKEVLEHFELKTVEELYARVGEGLLNAGEVIKISKSKQKSQEKGEEALPALSVKSPKAKQALEIQGLIPGMAVHFAGCCHPLPGEPIIGVVNTGKGITIHTGVCEFLEQFDKEPRRLIDVSWGQSEGAEHVGRLFVMLSNKAGSLGTLTTVIGKNEGNIVNLKITRRHYDFFDMIIDINVKDLEHLQHILASLRACGIVNTAERV